ncbi:MAG: PadR family transcriptional regulator [Furfurilactobacillus sp.]|jgi:DNA-binding PadR family transcriptional regulator|uniref:PadR family transcriptional regulator n=2 Tax=Furfurilactobacillus TaxID=2767882 RepID=A0ABT6DA32_9LACO|nr:MULTISPECIES: PadR family transcriptional regulator [Furfurilactobacillus]QLE65407.1 Transcriptional regulator PadR [Furfurilactobacillus rossiae]MCF6160905.1 PadR family transcriptional regulator [Furfurilactobacillus milii]MCF6163329.1 PadR family transcriptional regulator [Furfurilactobacillus milii]MCH4011925.1 PadR family transcriptional regulator [Furfurilactobacillus sp.]MCH4037817.1 PadR family transcriptional regulator [Furfurilactobacillus sp.]
MYELFVLGQLTDKTMTGYRLRTVLQRIVGNRRKISFGMIYPLLDRLEARGFITLTDSQDDANRGKKDATLTEQGRERFEELMTDPVPLNQNTDFTYEVKFRNFHQIETDLQLSILNDFEHYLENKIKDTVEAKAYMKQTNIEPDDFKDAVRLMALTKVQATAALEWTRATIEEVQNENKD